MNKVSEYPKTYTVSYFKEGSDRRDFKDCMYQLTDTVKDSDDEDAFFNSLNHEANLTIHKK